MYYRGAQVVIMAFDVSAIDSISHVRQWLERSLEDNSCNYPALPRGLSCSILSDGTRCSEANAGDQHGVLGRIVADVGKRQRVFLQGRLIGVRERCPLRVRGKGVSLALYMPSKKKQ